MSSTAPLPLRLDAERTALLDGLVRDLDAESLTWLSGYLAGLAQATRGARAAVSSHQAAAAPGRGSSAVATVVYGSQTGNGRRIAERLEASLQAAGLAVRLASAAEYKPRELATERLLYLVVSTHGEGDPPDDARALVEFLLGRRAPQLPDLRYAVFALGDSSYPQFCATGRLLDGRLAALGARRLMPRVDADVDFDPPARDWIERATVTAREEIGGPRLAVVRPLHLPSAQAAAGATREAPREVEAVVNHPLTTDSAVRAVRHVEFLPVDGADFPYEPGDAIGIWPENPRPAVERIATALGANAADVVAIDGDSRTLGEWLGQRREITRLTRPFLEEHARRTDATALRHLLAPEQSAAFRDFLRTRQVADVLADWPAQWTPVDLVRALRPLAPRLYSIASSRKAVGEEIHVAVALVDEEVTRGWRRQGAASCHLAGLAPEARVKAFLEVNARFRLPADTGRDIVMIGAGTGVAPYRAFLQERVETGATGRQWLFFGNRHLRRDFLYQAEWLAALENGTLTRLDVAFSRDQDARRYVQRLLVERGAELYRWIDAGAAVYVCGDAERMAPDVEAALRDVLAIHGGLAPEAARERLAELAAEGRYLRDVY
mgnify:CR=1 FL=1